MSGRFRSISRLARQSRATKIIFREFVGLEPEWCDAEPNVERMLAESDAALLIGRSGTS